MLGAGVLLPVVFSPLTKGWLPLHCDTRAGSLSRTATTVSSAFLLEALTCWPFALSKLTPRASGAHWLSAFKRPAKMHGLSASVDAVAAGGGFAPGVAGICAKIGALLLAHKKAKPAISDLVENSQEMWCIKTS